MLEHAAQELCSQGSRLRAVPEMAGFAWGRWSAIALLAMALLCFCWNAS